MSAAGPDSTDRDARLALGCVADAGDPEVAALVERLGAAEAWAAVLHGRAGRGDGGGGPRPWTSTRAGRQRTAPGRGSSCPGTRSGPTGSTTSPGSSRCSVVGASRSGCGCGTGTPGGPRRAVRRGRRFAGGDGVRERRGRRPRGRPGRRRVTVVSGGAFGIDAAAHRGALAVGGPSVGVVANGVDVAYPPGNARIFETLAARHLVVSELPPGSHPTRVRFLARNRLIASLSGGTVVVEAALRSGARNTAGWASALSRPLMAVPGPVHSAASVAPHLMVRNGQAVLVTRAAEVLELVASAGDHLLPQQQGPTRRTDDLDPVQLGVFEALSASRWRTAGDVATAAGVRVPVCLAALSELESRGLATGDARGWRATPRPDGRGR